MATFTQRCTLHANSGTASAVGGDYSAGTYLYVGDQSASFYDYLSYIRFTAVDIPAGSLINSATLNLTAGVLTSAVVITTVKAEAADNPAACSSAADVNGRTLTIASTNWDPSAWVVNTAYDSPDIASVIQEVVNRNGWVSGNAMQLFWSTRSTGWGGSNTLMGTYPDTGNGPLLTVNYTPRLGFDLRGPVPPGMWSPRTMRVVAGNTAAPVAAVAPTWVPSGQARRVQRAAILFRRDRTMDAPLEGALPTDDVGGIERNREYRGAFARRAKRRGNEVVPTIATITADPLVHRASARRVQRAVMLGRRDRTQDVPSLDVGLPDDVGGGIERDRAYRGAWARLARRRGNEVVPPQFNPPMPNYDTARQPRRVRGLARFRGRGVFPVPDTSIAIGNTAATPQAAIARRFRGVWPRRGRMILPVPDASLAVGGTPVTYQPARARAVRSMLSRRGRQVLPAPNTAAAIGNTPVTYQPARSKAVRSMLLRRGRWTDDPIIPADLPPDDTGDLSRIVRARAFRGLAPRRGHTPLPTPDTAIAVGNTPLVGHATLARTIRFALVRRSRLQDDAPPSAALPTDDVSGIERNREFRGMLGRRARRTETTPPQFNPPMNQLNVAAQPRRLRWMLARRANTVDYVPDQVTVATTPDLDLRFRRTPRKLLARTRSRSTTSPAAQEPVSAALSRRRGVAKLPRRSRVEVVPVQVTPPPVLPLGVPQPRRLRGLGRRRSVTATVLDTSVAVGNTPVTYQPARVRAMRGLLPRRGHTLLPTPDTSVAVGNTPTPPDRRTQRRLVAVRRSKPATLIAAQQPTIGAPARRARVVSFRRRRVVEVVPPQLNPPLGEYRPVAPSKRVRGFLPRHGRVVQPVDAQRNPPLVLGATRTRLRLWMRRAQTIDAPPTQDVQPPPPFIPDASRSTQRRVSDPRGRTTPPPLAQDTPPANLEPTKRKPRPSLRRQRVEAPLRQVAPPTVLSSPRVPRRWLRRVRNVIRTRSGPMGIEAFCLTVSVSADSVVASTAADVVTVTLGADSVTPATAADVVTATTAADAVNGTTALCE